MKQIFFNMPHSIDKVAKIIFDSLGLNSFEEGDSSHVKDGIYYASSVFGIKVQLEGNSYDYDDQYSYMLSIKQDVLSAVYSDDLIVAEIANVIIRLLREALETEIAYEDNSNTLRLYSDLTVKAFGTN
jgi:hypothetical protein